MTPARVCLGRDVRLLAEIATGVEIEGQPRLRPGHPVEVVVIEDEGRARVRTATVWTWSVTSLGSAGPTYRGFCRWT